MKKRNILALLFASAVLACVAAFPKLGHTQGGLSVSVNLNEGGHEHGHRHFLDHKEIDAAMRSLGDAIGHLNSAGHDFGGHRAKAIRIANNAMAECNAAIQYANSHDR